jgi:type IV pilus assembly protein PilN
MMDFNNGLIAKFKEKFSKKGADQIPVLGVDFSHHYVRISQLDKSGESWVLSKFASRAIESSIKDTEALEIEQVRIIQQLLKENKFNTDKCAVSLPITAAIVKVVKIPLLKDFELKQAVENGSLWESTIQLPSELSEYSVFWQVVSKNEAKNEMSILFVASKKSEIDNTVELLSRAGLDALVVDVRCFALRNILRTRGEQAPNQLNAFLELSADENYLVIVDGNLPFIYDIFLSEDDNQLIQLGQFDNLDYVFTRLSDQIRAAIQSFFIQSGRNTINVIEFASSLSNADLVLTKIKQAMPDFKIEILDPIKTILVPENLKANIQADKNKSSKAVSIGLASRRLDVFGYYKFVTAVSNINLLPNREERLDQQKRKVVISDSAKKIGILFSAIGIFVFTLSVVFSFMFSYSDKVTELTKKYQELEQKKTQVDTQLTNMQSFINQRAARNERILGLRFLNGLPRSIMVKELKLNYETPSVLILMAKDASQFSNVVALLNKHPDISAAKLEGIELESGKRDQQLGKIVMVLK